MFSADTIQQIKLSCACGIDLFYVLATTRELTDRFPCILHRTKNHENTITRVLDIVNAPNIYVTNTAVVSLLLL